MNERLSGIARVLALMTLWILSDAACTSDAGSTKWQELTAVMREAGVGQTQPSDPTLSALRAAYTTMRQAAADARYGFSGIEGGFAADNPAQQIGVRVSASTVEISETLGSWAFELQLTEMGRGDAFRSAPEVESVQAEENLVRLQRGILEEWYVNGPLGIEQGWTISQRPDGADDLILVVTFNGATPTEDVKGVALRNEGHHVIARYTGLFVKDADGRELVSSMQARGDHVYLRIADAGARYPLEVDPLVWVEEAKLLAGDGAANDQLGETVSVSGDTAVIGAITDSNGVDSGAAYVFVRNGSMWSQQAKLLPNDAAPGDAFGSSVSVSGDTALIGARGDDDSGPSSGSSYVFIRSGTVWTQQAKLLAADGDSDDYFGHAVSVSGDTALIGAFVDEHNGSFSGSAYVFARTGTVWTQQAKLLANDGAPGDNLGESVSLSGDTAIAGAVGDGDNGALSGAAYVFVRSGSVWSQQAKLLASDGAPFDFFGLGVSLSGDTALVGARRDDDNGTDSGSAYVFVRSGILWSQQAKLVASDGASDDYFGQSVCVSGDTAVVAAPGDDDGGSESGSAYVFVRVGNVWNPSPKLLPSSGGAGDYFGAAVSATTQVALVGAPFDDDNASNAGAVYAFSAKKANGDPCINGSECASTHCVDDLCCDSSCPDECEACNLAGNEGTCSNVASGTACGDPSGVPCDQPDSCDGAGSCQDNVAPSGAPCGNSNATECDQADTCDGTGTCLSNIQPGGSPCGDTGVACHIDDVCDSAGTCLDNGLLSAGSACGDEGIPCRVNDVCDAAGACLDGGVLPQSTPCGDASQTSCTAPDSCDASGNCLSNHAPVGTSCLAIECELPAACDQNGVCVGECPDATFCEGVACVPKRANGEGCEHDEACLSGNCSDSVCCDVPCSGGCGNCNLPGSEGRCIISPAGEVCRAAVDQTCDPEELCDGVIAGCPDDMLAQDGKTCSGGTCKEGFCNELPTDPGGCGCTLPGRQKSGWWVALLALIPVVARRRALRRW